MVSYMCKTASGRLYPSLGAVRQLLKSSYSFTQNNYNNPTHLTFVWSIVRCCHRGPGFSLHNGTTGQIRPSFPPHGHFHSRTCKWGHVFVAKHVCLCAYAGLYLCVWLCALMGMCVYYARKTMLLLCKCTFLKHNLKTCLVIKPGHEQNPVYKWVREIIVDALKYILSNLRFL